MSESDESEGREYAEITMTDGSIFFTDLFVDSHSAAERPKRLWTFLNGDEADAIGGYMLRPGDQAPFNLVGQPTDRGPFDPNKRTNYYAYQAVWCMAYLFAGNVVSIIV